MTALAVGLAVAFLALDPARTVTVDAALRLGRGLLVAVAVLFAQLGAGSAVVSAWGERRWVWAFGVGMGIHTAGMVGLFLVGMVTPWACAALLVAMAAGWAVRPWPALPRLTPTAALIGGLLLLPALFDALAPPTDTDEIYYQLAVPRFLLEHGDLGVGLLHPDHSRPLPVQLLHAATLALGGEAAPRLWHLGVAVALVLAVRGLAEERFGPRRGDLPALALLGSYTFLREAGLAYNDLPCAFWLLLTADGVLAGSLGLAGLAAGLAVAAKFTAGPAAAVLLVLGTVDLARRGLTRGVVGRVAGAAALAVLPTLPWALRNALAGLHPLFPFAGWPAAAGFVFVYPEKYGDGHTWLDAALLPLRLLFTAEPGTFTFYGRLSLLWLPLAGAALLAIRPSSPTSAVSRRLLLAVAVGFVAWASSAQLLRYLLPIAGVAALAGGALPFRRAWLLLLAVSLPANLAPALTRAAASAAVVTGHETADAYLERELTAWPAVRYVREHVPLDDTVALLNCWPAYWVPQRTVLGSVEDNVPVRYWLWAHGDGALRELAQEGVRWLLVGDIKYLRKTYAFLPPPMFEAQFTRPQHDLEELLLRDATRVFRENHHSVWRLDAAPPPP